MPRLHVLSIFRSVPERLLSPRTFPARSCAGHLVWEFEALGICRHAAALAAPVQCFVRAGTLPEGISIAHNVNLGVTSTKLLRPSVLGVEVLGKCEDAAASAHPLQYLIRIQEHIQ